jgi:hypothetical protein
MPLSLNAPAIDPAALAQLLDEHHLVVTGADRSARHDIADTLAHQLVAIPDTQVVRLRGDRICDLAGFCHELETVLFDDRCIPRTLPALISHLRACPAGLKHLYVVWDDADELLRRDPETFARLVNALFGVSAELEHVSMDVLVLQRVVLLGDGPLSACAERADGPLRSWVMENGETPFWEVVSCLPRPPVLTYRLDG